MDNEEKDSVSETEEKSKKTGTLNLESVSISTLKDDLEKKDNPDNEKDKAGGGNSWFSFLAKHQPTTDSANPTQNSSEPKTKQSEGERTDSTVASPAEDENKIVEENKKDFAEITNQGIEELKIENDLEKPVEAPPATESEVVKSLGNEGQDKKPSLLEKQLEAFKSIGAPKNLPVSEPTNETEGGEFEANPTEGPSIEKEKDNPVPPLSSFIAPKIEPSTQNKLSEMLAGKDTSSEPNNEEPVQTADSEKAEQTDKESSGEESLPDINLQEDDPTAKKDPIKFMSAEPTVKDEESIEKDDDALKNPFTARLETKPGGDKSLLQAVESALNYSAPAEYAEEREKMESQNDENGETPTIETGVKPSKNGLDKKWFIIGGGALAGVVVLVVIVVLMTGGSSKQPANANQNQNIAVSNTNDNEPIRPLNTNTNKKPVVTMLKAPRIIPNVEEIKIAEKTEINSYLSEMRTGGGVSKMTQLIFIDTNGSAISFKDLMDNTEISIPEKVLLDPTKSAAMLVADFFSGKSILGLVIKSQSDTITTLEKMKTWEATMIIDLSELWKGIIIDNPNAYFADSGVFKNGRFALIDKKSGLSLDYLVENGYIFIACGRDSMTVLRSKFIPPNGSAPTTPEPNPTSPNPDPTPKTIEDDNANANSNSNPQANSNKNLDPPLPPE